MQNEILTKNPDQDITVYAVWFNVLPTDSLGQWNPKILSDGRATEFWDAEGALGEWFGDNRDQMGFGFFGDATVWDAGFLFGPEATWEKIPQPLEQFGRTIIADRDALRRSLEAIWAEAPAA